MRRDMFVTLLRAIVAGVLVCSTAPAQTATAPAPTSTRPAEDLVKALSGVAGVVPGMSAADLLKLAKERLQQKSLDDAERIVSELATRYGDDLDVLTTLAAVYDSQSNSLAADPALRPQAADRAKAAVWTYLRAAPLAMATGQTRLAEQMYNRVLAYQRGNAEALLGLARILAATNREMLAIDRYREYLRTPVDDTVRACCFGDGRCQDLRMTECIALGGYPQVESSTCADSPCRSAQLTGGGNRRRQYYGDVDSLAQLELGRLYRKAQFFSQAITALQAARQINPEDPEIFNELAISYYEGRDFDKARSFAEQAVEKSKKSKRYPEYRATLATIRLARQENMDALAEARGAIEAARDSLKQTRDDRPMLQTLSGSYRAYRQILTVLIAAPDADPALRLELARAVQNHAAVDQTLSMYQALDILLATPTAADNVPVLEEVARLQLALSKPAVALAATCQRLLQLQPGNTVAQDILKRLPTELQSQVPGTRAAP